MLTFDYELFLGTRSGSVLKCMIEPTKEILKVLQRHNAKAIFFVDTTYLARLEEVKKVHPNADKDFDSITRQLEEILKGGHYLFHHLHPHWLDAAFIPASNEWNLEDTSRFALHHLKEPERDRLFAYSTVFLARVHERVNSTLSCNGFRAGGLFIEPFSCFKPLFEKYAVRYDFSVLPGEKKEGRELFYDFSECCFAKPYTFTDNLMSEVRTGQFTEFPISRIRISGATKAANAIYYRLTRGSSDSAPFGDGTSVSSKINRNREKRKLVDYLRFDLALSVEMLTPALLPLYKRKIASDEFVHFLSHPKLLSRASLRDLDKLLTYARRCFSTEFDFMNMLAPSSD